MNYRQYFLCALLPITGPALASELELALGGGSDRYETYTTRAALDLPNLPLSLDLDYNHIRSERSEVLSQTGAGLSWQPTDWFSASYRYTDIREQTTAIRGNEFAASVNLNPLWKGELSTRLDVGLGDYDYDPRVGPAVAQQLAGRVPRQRRYTLGISQNLSEDFYIYASYDDYRYTTDPAFLAGFLIRRFNRPINAASTLASLPKVGRTLGMGWYVSDKWLLDASYADSDTVRAQAQDVKKLKLSYFWNKTYTWNLTLTRSDSAELRGINGQQVSATSASNVIEVGTKVSF